MKHQTYLPNSIPSSKPASQEGKKDKRSLLTRVLVIILVVTFALALYLTASSLPVKAYLSRLTRASQNYPAIYDARLVMDQAVVLPGQVARTTSRIAIYDATGVMLEAITPKAAAYNRTFPYVYDATGAMLEAITPKEVKVARGPVYDATGVMLEAIVYP
jgi:hypothetical protein